MKLSRSKTPLLNPKWVYQKLALHLITLSLISVSVYCQGQGTFQPIHITFDGPPLLPPGSAYTVQQYYESGMSFTPIDPNAPWAGFGRSGAATDPRDPDNGTAYLQATLTDTLSFSFINGSVFNMDSVDLAEYSTVMPGAVTVHFFGYRPDGSMVTTDFTTDGIIDGTGPLADFQTFNFQGFTGLSRVEIPTYGWSLDNLVVSVPEPSIGSLLFLGAVLGGLRFLKRNQTSWQPGEITSRMKGAVRSSGPCLSGGQAWVTHSAERFLTVRSGRCYHTSR